MQGSPIENALGTGSISVGSDKQIRVAITTNSRSVSVGNANFDMSIIVGSHGVRDVSGIVTVAEHAITAVSGHGFAPGSTVTIWVYSAGAKMGTTTVTNAGTFAVSEPLPASIGLGRHTIVARGFDKHHAAIAIALGIRVIADTVAPSAVASSSNTGAYIGGAIAILFVIVGGFFFLARRRREEEEEIQVAT